MLTRLRSLEQLMPFATAGELLRRLNEERVTLLFPYPSSY
jgi:hypothetical protein